MKSICKDKKLVDAEEYYEFKINSISAKIRNIKKTKIAKNSGIGFVTFISNR
jgi:hypothetical protein